MEYKSARTLKDVAYELLNRYYVAEMDCIWSTTDDHKKAIEELDQLRDKYIQEIDELCKE